MAKPRKARKSGAKQRSHKQATAGGGDHWLYGVHAVIGAMENPNRRIHRILITEEAAKTHADSLYSAQQNPDLPQIEQVARDDIHAVLPESAVHQGIAALASPLEEVFLEDVLAEIAMAERAAGKKGSDDWETQLEGRTVLLVLDHVTDPQNVGAILRSAAAFGAKAVITTGRNAAPPTGALAKTASGALERIPYITVPNLVRSLEQIKAAGFWCFGLAGEGEKVLADALPESGKIALVMGAEGSGLRRLTRENCDLLVRLPTAEDFGVLNVSSAAAVALYETARG